MNRTILLILLFWLVIIFTATLAVVARGEKITLTWDTVDGVDGYYIYQYGKDEQYDYNKPVTTVVYPDGKIPQDVDRLIVDLPGIEGRDVKYRWVARSFRGDEQSVDSNEASYVVALTVPPAPGELAGSFDKPGGMINIAWLQPAEAEVWQTINHWIVYCREKGTENWNAVGRINSDHELAIEMPISAIITGDKATLEFVIVAYRRSGVYSSNSDILTIDVDTSVVPPMQNLRINIQFLVE